MPIDLLVEPLDSFGMAGRWILAEVSHDFWV
jgi:hypothetical protein